MQANFVRLVYHLPFFVTKKTRIWTISEKPRFYTLHILFFI